FFQAEDGIRDDLVTGVQTCALPICATGEYVFLEVPVGTYQIEVTQQGFKKFLRKNITLELNQILTLDIPLQLGGSTEVVEVTGRSEERRVGKECRCGGGGYSDMRER